MKLKLFSFLSTSVVSIVLLATSASTFGYSLKDKINNVQTANAEKAIDNLQFHHANFGDRNFMATQSNQSYIATEKQDKTKIYTFIFAIISFIFVLICVVAFFSNFERYQNKKKRISKSLFEQVPCRKCQYLHENCYVPCAVQPTMTLTAEALNCPDFSPKS